MSVPETLIRAILEVYGQSNSPIGKGSRENMRREVRGGITANSFKKFCGEGKKGGGAVAGRAGEVVRVFKDGKTGSVSIPKQRYKVKREIVKVRKEDCWSESWSSREKVGWGM